MQRTWFSFAGVPSDPQAVRAQLSAFFFAEGWASEQQTDMLLVASELATNAVVHAGTGFRVECVVDRVVTIEVEDRNPQAVPSLRAPSSTGLGGFGLRIVDRLAQEWTVEVREHTKLVRAVFDRPCTSSAPSEPARRGNGRSPGA